MQLEEEDIGGNIDLAEDEGALAAVLDEYLQVCQHWRMCTVRFTVVIDV